MDNDSNKIKELVREGYSQVVSQQKSENEKSLCGIGECCSVDYTIFSEDYSNLKGYCKTADLGVGCGIPTNSINIKEGYTVLDLGCGAGNDCFIARNFVGDKGKVIGLDFTPEMLKKAWENLDSLGFNNVEFRFGDIEKMPVANGIIDVVISNCVINLVPDKKKAFIEINRVLKSTGFFSVSDVVTSKPLPLKLKNSIDFMVGCVSGAMVKEEYLNLISDCDFIYEIKKEKEVLIPEESLRKILNEDEIKDYINQEIKILSITVIGRKIKNTGAFDSCCSKGNQC